MKIEKRRKIKKLVIFISIIALIALIISILYFYFYKNTKFYLKEELFETQINNTYDLTDNIKLSNLKIEELKITSSNDSIVSVENNNIVTKDKIGKAVIKVNYKNLTKDFIVDVKGDNLKCDYDFADIAVYSLEDGLKKGFSLKTECDNLNVTYNDNIKIDINLNYNNDDIYGSVSINNYLVSNQKLNVTNDGIIYILKTDDVYVIDIMGSLSQCDYKGNIIKNGYYYVVLKVNLKNNSGLTRKIDFNQFNLSVGGTLIKPTLSMSSYFIDYASENVISEFSHKTDKTFALVYEINEKNRNSRFKLDIYNGTVKNKKDYTTKHIYVSIHPKKISDLKLNGNYALGQKVTFDDTYLGNTILKVQSYELNKTYFYTYEKCFKDNCNAYDDAITVPFTASRHNNYILTLHINYTPDGDMLYSKSNTLPRRFANDFMTIQYKVDDKVYSNNSINVTPDYQKDFIAFEVGGEIVDASVIQAIVTIRNQKYIINLKS